MKSSDAAMFASTYLSPSTCRRFLRPFSNSSLSAMSFLLDLNDANSVCDSFGTQSGRRGETSISAAPSRGENGEPPPLGHHAIVADPHAKSEGFGRETGLVLRRQRRQNNCNTISSGA